MTTLSNLHRRASRNILTEYGSFFELAYAMRIGRVPSDIAFFADRAGENNDIDMIEEDVWPAGGIRTEMYSGDAIEVLSSDAADTIAGGTGATLLLASFLDADYNRQEEVIALNGITPVVTAGSNYLHCYNALVIGAGSSNTNVGDITFRMQSGGETTAYMAAAQARTQMSHYIVPDGYSMQIINAEFGIGGNQGGSGGNPRIGDINAKVQFPGSQIWINAQKFVGTSATGFRGFDVSVGVPIFPSRMRLKFSASSELDNTRAVISWGAICIKNEYLLGAG